MINKIIFHRPISSHHCSNEANIEKFKSINIHSNFVFLVSLTDTETFTEKRLSSWNSCHLRRRTFPIVARLILPFSRFSSIYDVDLQIWGRRR